MISPKSPAGSQVRVGLPVHPATQTPGVVTSELVSGQLALPSVTAAHVLPIKTREHGKKTNKKSRRTSAGSRDGHPVAVEVAVAGGRARPARHTLTRDAVRAGGNRLPVGVVEHGGRAVNLCKRQTLSKQDA